MIAAQWKVLAQCYAVLECEDGGHCKFIRMLEQDGADLREVTTPRAQVQTMMKGSYNYSSAWHAVSSIVRQRGLRGMLKGYWAGNSVRSRPSARSQEA